MTEEELAGVREFLATLPQKRQQLADTALLDQCQEWLGKLIAHIDDAHQAGFAPAGSQKAEEIPAQPEEPHYPEPAHIEDVPPDEPFVHHRTGQAEPEHLEDESRFVKEVTPKPKVTRKHPHKR